MTTYPDLESIPNLSEFYTSSLDLSHNKDSMSYRERLEEAREIGSMTWPEDSKYKIIDAIAVGGMGAVLRAWDNASHRDVAMKVMHRSHLDSPASQRFVREARIVASLEHPNIVPVHDIGVSPLDEPYFTMKWVQGENLAEIFHRLGRRGPSHIDKYPLHSLLEIFIKICNGVASRTLGISHTST